MSDVMFAFLLTLMAGLFTGVGGLVAFFSRKLNPNFLAVSLGFSAGVMIYISFVEIFAKSYEMLGYAHEDNAMLFTTIAFFGGILLIALIEKLVPHEHATSVAFSSDTQGISISKEDARSLKRIGLMSAIAIAIHNFPEGLVTFMAAMHDPALGVSIAVAIAIHNIPEGIAIAVPIRYATGSKKKALLASLASGLTEPLGAIVAYLILAQFMNDSVFGLTFALVGGIMVYIAVEQLLPTAQKYGKHSQVMASVFIGMAVMAASLVILG